MSIDGGADVDAAEAQMREEEEMTSYTPEDLAGEWEFKILHSYDEVFRDPQKLHAVLDEEARAGWELLEKLDNKRLRLKRPTSARQLDGKLDFNPYRSYVGPPNGDWMRAVPVTLIVMVCLMVLPLGPIFRDMGWYVLGLVVLLGLVGFLVYSRWHLRTRPRKPPGLDDLL